MVLFRDDYEYPQSYELGKTYYKPRFFVEYKIGDAVKFELPPKFPVTVDDIKKIGN